MIDATFFLPFRVIARRHRACHEASEVEAIQTMSWSSGLLRALQ